MEKYKAGYKKKYWFIEIDRQGHFSVQEDINTFSLKHISRFTLGNMFPSMEEAVASLKSKYGKIVNV